MESLKEKILIKKKAYINIYIFQKKMGKTLTSQNTIILYHVTLCFVFFPSHHKLETMS